VLVNNAGYAQIGVFEETSEADVQIQFETNVFGLMRVTRAVLPTMRAQRAGHIINFSSIAGVVPFELCTLYTAIGEAALAKQEWPPASPPRRG
jgi:short-subunit dehydrogenase